MKGEKRGIKIADNLHVVGIDQVLKWQETMLVVEVVLGYNFCMMSKTKNDQQKPYSDAENVNPDTDPFHRRKRFKPMPQFRSRRGKPCEKAVAKSDARENKSLAQEYQDSMMPSIRLSEAVNDGALVRTDDLKATLVERILQADRQAKTLATRSEQLLEMLFTASTDQKGAGNDISTGILDLITRLSGLHHGYAAEVRKDIALLDRLARPRSPSIQVVAAGEQVNVGATQQVNNTGR